MTDSTSIIAYGAPAMGVGILLVLWVAAMRLRDSDFSVAAVS